MLTGSLQRRLRVGGKQYDNEVYMVRACFQGFHYLVVGAINLLEYLGRICV